MHRGDISRKGSILQTLSGINDITIPKEFDFKLIGNAPNPFNPITIVRYNIHDVAPLDLFVYSLEGKLVMSKHIANPEPGLNEITINMADYSSGIYLYSLNYKGMSKKAKMIYLK